MISGRLTPPSIQDGPYGWEPRGTNNFDLPPRGGSDVLDAVTARKLGVEVWESSTSWLNSGRRVRWSDSLRAFQSLHASGSKYLSGDYRYRSTLYRPKSRAMVRRDEAATASAFFANEDVVSITAGDDDDPRQQASAEIMKQLLQFYLADAEPPQRIPWFMTLVGGRQDAEIQGICVSKTTWEYEERYLRTEMRPSIGPDGMPVWDAALGMQQMEDVDIYEKVKDEPSITLLAPENIRFEPGCDWRDPVKSSPYFIESCPVYIHEALERMESQHGAPAEWLSVPSSALRASTDFSDDVTRRAREQGRVPGKDENAYKPRDFDICWTRLNIMRWKGRDWCFRTLAGAGEILEPPRPIEEVYLHGKRPYVVGCVVLETHKTYPSSKIELTRDLQWAANMDWNTRFDNIMLSLQPRQFVREGSGVDLNDLRTFMPGKVTMVQAPKDQPLASAVMWDRPPPVDGAAFQEQDRINLDWDDLTGAFTNSSVQASQIGQQSATGMNLMSGEASGLNEYELRLFAETFVEPTLRMLVQVIQAYVTDPVVLGLAGKKAALFQKYGIDAITDELLNQGVTTKVNVGIGATNPQLKLRNFATGADIISKIFGPAAAMGANFEEVCKEVFGMCGFKDGARFFQPDFDPRVQMLQEQMAKVQKGQHGASAAPTDPMRLEVAKVQAQGKIEEKQIQASADAHTAQADYNLEQMKEQMETNRQWMEAHKDLLLAQHQASQAAAAPQAVPSVASGPPAHALREGHTTLFGNGQRWSMRGGKPRQVA